MTSDMYIFSEHENKDNMRKRILVLHHTKHNVQCCSISLVASVSSSKVTKKQFCRIL